MNPYKAYQSQRDLGLSRIDTLLALYDEAISALERMAAAHRSGNGPAAARLLDRARLAVTGLAAGVDASYGEVPLNLLLLYEYVLHCLQRGAEGDVADVLEILGSLREGMQAIRPEALALERCGAVPPITAVPQFQAQA